MSRTSFNIGRTCGESGSIKRAETAYKNKRKKGGGVCGWGGEGRVIIFWQTIA